eukprot:132478_1
MGKVLTTLKKLKGKDQQDRIAQQSIFSEISTNPDFHWQNPDHKSTMVEATRAAQRLSVYHQPPEDSYEREKYLQDQRKVDVAIETLKKHQKGNTQIIKFAVEKAMTTPGGPTPGGPNDQGKSKSSHSSDQKLAESDDGKHLYGSGLAKQELPSAHPDFQPKYTASFNESESWDDSDDDNNNNTPQPIITQNDPMRHKSVSSSYAGDDEHQLTLPTTNGSDPSPRIQPNVISYSPNSGKTRHSTQPSHELHVDIFNASPNDPSPRIQPNVISYSPNNSARGSPQPSHQLHANIFGGNTPVHEDDSSSDSSDDSDSEQTQQNEQKQYE